MISFGLQVCNLVFLVREIKGGKFVFETATPVKYKVSKGKGAEKKEMVVERRYSSNSYSSSDKAVQGAINFATRHNLVGKAMNELAEGDVKVVETPKVEKKPFGPQAFARPDLLSGLKIPTKEEVKEESAPKAKAPTPKAKK